MKTRIICLLTACVVLVSAISVSAVNGSPYEQLKNAMFNFMYLDNYTVEIEGIMILNGEIVESYKNYDSNGFNSSVSISDSYTSFSNNDIRYATLGRKAQTDEHWYSVREVNDFSTFSIWNDVDRGSNQVRLMELLVDLIVGDLRHNVSMSRRVDERFFSGEITGVQLPEIVKLGLEIMQEDGEFDFEDITVRNFSFDRLRGEATVDSNDNLTYMSVNVNITLTDTQGVNHSFVLGFTTRITDIGTSNPQSPINGAVELFTPEFIQSHIENSSSRSLYFTVDSNGNINRESITTEWPNNLW